MKNRKILSMVVSVILMLVLSISIVGCKNGGTPTEKTTLHEYSKTVNDWLLNSMQTENEFKEKSLTVTCISAGEKTEEYEYYEQEGDTEMVTKTHTSTSFGKAVGNLEFKQVGENYFAYSKITGNYTESFVSVDSVTNLLVIEEETVNRELEYRLGVIPGDSPTYYISCKDTVTISNTDDIENGTTYTYNTFSTVDEYLDAMYEIYYLFNNHELTPTYSLLEKNTLGSILEINNIEDASAFDILGSCVYDLNSPFIPLFLANYTDFTKTGDLYNSSIQTTLNGIMGVGTMYANFKFNTSLTAKELKETHNVMSIAMMTDLVSNKNTMDYKTEFYSKANFNTLSNLDGYELDTLLTPSHFFDLNNIFAV